jgi:tetratricopeptide (TPR) repeat protein
MIAILLLAAVLTQDGAGLKWKNQLAEANRFRSENRHAEAEAAYGLARAEAEKFGAEELPLAITLNDMAYHYQCMGRLFEAERAFAWALGIVERRLGPASRGTVEVAMNLTGVYLETGQVSRAEALVRRFLERRAELSPRDRATLSAELASVLGHEKKHAEAERLFTEAAAILERDPSPYSQEQTVIIMNNLATICIETNRMAEARAHSERARSLLAALHEPMPIVAIKTLANAAVLATKAGALDEAESLFRAAISLCESRFGPDYYLLGQVLNNYSECLSRLHRKADAKKAGKRAKAILERFRSENFVGYTVDAKTFR